MRGLRALTRRLLGAPECPEPPIVRGECKGAFVDAGSAEAGVYTLTLIVEGSQPHPAQLRGLLGPIEIG